MVTLPGIYYSGTIIMRGGFLFSMIFMTLYFVQLTSIFCPFFYWSDIFLRIASKDLFWIVMHSDFECSGFKCHQIIDHLQFKWSIPILLYFLSSLGSLSMIGLSLFLFWNSVFQLFVYLCWLADFPLKYLIVLSLSAMFTMSTPISGSLLHLLIRYSKQSPKNIAYWFEVTSRQPQSSHQV